MVQGWFCGKVFNLPLMIKTLSETNGMSRNPAYGHSWLPFFIETLPVVDPGRSPSLGGMVPA